MFLVELKKSLHSGFVLIDFRPGLRAGFEGNF
jgi:hypothetical protein